MKPSGFSPSSGSWSNIFLVNGVSGDQIIVKSSAADSSLLLTEYI